MCSEAATVIPVDQNAIGAALRSLVLDIEVVDAAARDWVVMNFLEVAG